MLIEIDKIRRDGGTQPRATIDFDVAHDYGDEMKAGVKFPPVVSFYDGTYHWLADGFHRVEGAYSAGFTDIDCDVHQGTVNDAQWYPYGVNKSHGLRRTNEDKQRAVKAALNHPNSSGLSDRLIAKHVGVTHVTIGEWRNKLAPLEDSSSRPPRTGSDGRTINTANIGRKPETCRQGLQLVPQERQSDHRRVIADVPMGADPPESAIDGEAILQAIYVLAEATTTDKGADFIGEILKTVVGDGVLIDKVNMASVFMLVVCRAMGIGYTAAFYPQIVTPVPFTPDMTFR